MNLTNYFYNPAFWLVYWKPVPSHRRYFFFLRKAISNLLKKRTAVALIVLCVYNTKALIVSIV